MCVEGRIVTPTYPLSAEVTEEMEVWRSMTLAALLTLPEVVMPSSGCTLTPRSWRRLPGLVRSAVGGGALLRTARLSLLAVACVRRCVRCR